MTGRPRHWTMEMNGGSSASYLARTPCVPFCCALFNRGGNRRAFRLPGAGGGSFPLYGGTFARSYLVSKDDRTTRSLVGTRWVQHFVSRLYVGHFLPRLCALGHREFTQEGPMTISPFAAREGTSAPQWPNLKKMLLSPRSVQWLLRPVIRGAERFVKSLGIHTWNSQRRSFSRLRGF